MKTKTKIIIAAIGVGALVIASQRKKLMALLTAGAPAQPAGTFPIGADAPAPAQALVSTTVNAQQVSQLVNTTVTTLAGVAGLAITMMTLTEKKRALAKAA
jgi:hypothetical protein